MHPAGLLDRPQHDNIIRSPSKIDPTLTPHIHQPLILRLVIISFRPAWLARDTALASSVHSLQEMTDADEGRKTPFDAQGGLCL